MHAHPDAERPKLDLSMLRPCRFCGKDDMLQVHPGYDVRLAYVGDALAKLSNGDMVEETYDAVECHSCCVTAPFDVWQLTGDIYSPAQRQAYADFCLAQDASFGLGVRSSDPPEPPVSDGFRQVYDILEPLLPRILAGKPV